MKKRLKCLIFSDSHGSVRGITKALSYHPDAEVVFFLGDGLADLESLGEALEGRALLAVRGNCDYHATLRGMEVKKTEAITLSGHRIVYTHGDLYGVKYGTGGIVRLLEETGADILLFGHTHIPYSTYVNEERPYYLFNPGTVGGGFGGASYGVLILSECEVLFSHGEL